MTRSTHESRLAAQRAQAELHAHPVNELHAAFWGVPHNTVTMTTYHASDTLPARTHSLMQQEVKELLSLNMARVPYKGAQK